MRRAGVVLLALIALVAMTAPASAQPKVTISGFVDNISSWHKNMNHVDNNIARNGDDEWYVRTRVRPDITAEVGTTKMVLGLEIDYAWGQTGAGDGSFGGGGPQKFGTNAGFDQNTDVAGIIEIKWAYTEFALPGIPLASVLRIGAQPTAQHYKPGVLHHGDMVGVHSTTTLAPIAKLHLTYVQIEEELTGARDGFPRGEDWSAIASVEVTPFKGLDIRPIFAYAQLEGTTGQARLGRGGISNTAGFFPNSAREDRFTIGVDGRWRFGAFSLDPTVFYQFGNRDVVIGGGEFEQKRSAWLVDIAGGWQAGPLLLELRGAYTTGNKAGDRIDQGADLDHYEPISTDSGFWGGWAEIWALNIDYFNSQRPRVAGLNTITAIGYDKYGLIRAGARASYALTPAFTLRAAANANWAAENVDTSSILVAASGLTPVDATGDSRYLGTEINLGFQWRFAPNVAFDMVGAYMFAGNALATSCVGGACGTAAGVNGRDPQDIQSVAARIRYSF